MRVFAHQGWTAAACAAIVYEYLAMLSADRAEPVSALRHLRAAASRQTIAQRHRCLGCIQQQCWQWEGKWGRAGRPSCGRIGTQHEAAWRGAMLGAHPSNAPAPVAEDHFRYVSLSRADAWHALISSFILIVLASTLDLSVLVHKVLLLHQAGFVSICSSELAGAWLDGYCLRDCRQMFNS